MYIDIQEHLASEYAQNKENPVKIHTLCQAISERSYHYSDMMLEKMPHDEKTQFYDSVLLPRRYVKNSKTLDGAFDNFINDIFDCDEAYVKSVEAEYISQGKNPQYVNITGINIPVPYKNRHYSYEEQVDMAIADALELYEIIEENLIEQKLNGAVQKVDEKAEQKIIEQTRLDFFAKRRKELLGVAAGLTLLGALSFGGNKAKEKMPEPKIAEVTTVTKVPEQQKQEKTADFTAELKKKEASEKANLNREKQAEVREKLNKKKELTQEQSRKVESQEKVAATKKIALENIKPDIAKLDLSKLNAQLEINRKDRFERIITETFQKEGGFGTTKKEAEKLRANGEKVAVIDQATNFGVTEPLLQNLRDMFPEKYGKLPKKVKDLKKKEAVLVMDYFYESFHSHRIENESLSQMLFDASYNHTPKTFRKFLQKALDSVEKKRDEKTDKKLTKSWSGKVNYLNSCDDKELKLFYDSFAKERLAFMKDGRVKEFTGIITRAEGYIDGFKVDKEVTQAISVAHYEKIIQKQKEEKSFTLAKLFKKSKTHS
ncbi:MAG: glycosyl hydrolase 108 family protein [Alphaproteobacteria bacterium]|nr:glycosyl hydrolase 108 family protein [Alphaproteobacteria bacterium]